MFNPLDERIRTLQGLGLTNNQAKIYLASLQTGCSTVKSIAHYAQIGREDVYRVLPSLQDLGLLKKHIGSPTLFEPVDPAEVVSLLLGNKMEELSELKAKALQFVEHCKNQSKDSFSDDSFVMVTNVNIAINTLIDSIKKTSQSWIFTSGFDRFIVRQNMPKKQLQIKEMYNAVQRGVKIKAVLDQPNDRMKLQKVSFGNPISRAFIEHENFQYRYIDSQHAGLLSIFDDKLMFIETQQGPRVLIPQLWSNNRVLLALGRSFFDQAWNLAYEPE